jgi:hypothetical protein
MQVLMLSTLLHYTAPLLHYIDAQSCSNINGAESDVPLEDIIAAADWSSATAFERFYYQAISKDKFVKSILATDVQK